MLISFQYCQFFKQFSPSLFRSFVSTSEAVFPLERLKVGTRCSEQKVVWQEGVWQFVTAVVKII